MNAVRLLTNLVHMSLLPHRYQSSLDLGADTYAMLRHLPLSRDVVLSARQELVMRLDGYVESDQRLFQEVRVITRSAVLFVFTPY